MAAKRAQADMAGVIETERKKIERTEQIKSVKQLEGVAEQVYANSTTYCFGGIHFKKYGKAHEGFDLSESGVLTFFGS